MEDIAKGVKTLSEQEVKLLEGLRRKVMEADDISAKILNEILDILEAAGGQAPWQDLNPVHRMFLKQYMEPRDVIHIYDIEAVVQKMMAKSTSPSLGEDPHGGEEFGENIHQIPNSPTFPKDVGELPQGLPQFPNTSPSVEEVFGEYDKDLILKAIGKVVKRANRPAARLAIFLLLKYNELKDPDLRERLAPLGRLFSKNKEPYEAKTIANAISVLRNDPNIWVSKDEITDVFVYKLKDDARVKILEEYNLLKMESEAVSSRPGVGDREEMIEAFVDLFRNYVDDSGEHIYLEKLADLITLKPSRSLLIDWQQVNSFNPELASAIIDRPEDMILSAKEAIRKVLKEDLLVEEPPRIHARFVNLPETLSPKHIESQHLAKLIQIKGIITAVAEGQRTDGRSGFIEKAVFVCKDCPNEMVRLQRPYEPFVAPAKCDACGSRNIELSLEKSRVIDKREVFVQDSEDAMRATTMPSYIRVILLDDLARMRLEPGDEVLMSIILRGVRKSPKDNSLAWVGEAVSVTKLTKDAEDIEITPRDEQKFREMADPEKNPDFEEKFIESIAPTVVGQDARRLKKALAWALFSGDDEVVGNMHIRNRIHVLAYGPPSTAKTTITKYATELAPRHYWVSAPTTSGAGLTAALDSMDGKRVLKAGALVIASGGVAGVNELDKMKDEEYDRLLDAMEEGQFTYNKAGFTTTLTAMTRLFATANPPGGEFNSDKAPIEELYQQFPRPLISRFDVIVIVREAKDLKEREAIADAIYQRRKKEVNPVYPPELLTKYIAFAHREIKEVDIPEEVWKVAKEYLLKITKNAPTAMPRMIEAFLRLMVARARMHLRDRVTIQDFIAVKDFYTEMLKHLLGTDSEEMMRELLTKFGGITWTEKEREMVDKLYNIIRYFEELSEEGAFLDDIIEEASQAGIDRADVLRLLEEMRREKLIDSPKPGRYVTKRR